LSVRSPGVDGLHSRIEAQLAPPAHASGSRKAVANHASGTREKRVGGATRLLERSGRNLADLSVGRSLLTHSQKSRQMPRASRRHRLPVVRTLERTGRPGWIWSGQELCFSLAESRNPYNPGRIALGGDSVEPHSTLIGGNGRERGRKIGRASGNRRHAQNCGRETGMDRKLAITGDRPTATNNCSSTRRARQSQNRAEQRRQLGLKHRGEGHLP
jgi:hypothetical protein